MNKSTEEIAYEEDEFLDRDIQEQDDEVLFEAWSV